MASVTPMQRTIAELNKTETVFGIVERFIGGAKIKVRVDFLNIIDLIALDPVKGVLGIQVCGNDFKAHVDKICVENAKQSKAWLSTPGTALEIWGWRKLKNKRGMKATHWECRVQKITLDDFPEPETDIDNPF